MNSDSYLAHLSPDGREQTVAAHLAQTGELCAGFAGKFGEEARGRFIGAVHDIGKCSREFQQRLRGGAKVDHASAGALKCAEIGEDAMACCVVGHHGGMPDFGNPSTDCAGAPTCVGRIRKAAEGKIPACHWQGSLPDPGSQPSIGDPYLLYLWTKMLYSCLVDGDFLDTERFMFGTLPGRGEYDSLPVLQKRLAEHIRPWFPGKTPLNRKRCEILSECLEKASRPRGVYSLTVPTGGGKTLSSLAFALNHGIANGMDRVIYVIPYTSIIEQNAAVFREILGENNVVEHHSGVSFDSDREIGQEDCFRRLAAENWDAPVIVTTAVEFFESIYANRPSRCRKLHNIANSVIIFDEAQMLPNGHLLPCVGAMAELVAQFRSTVVLCSATQPVLGDLFRRFCPDQQITELCPGLAESFRDFRRVTYRDGGVLSWEATAEAMKGRKQALCIVNTRKAAQFLYACLPEEGRFHLSTLMYPAHRKQVLKTIRERLTQGLTCRVVSTSLIEAGVDIDFPAVWREMAGLDSIAQAAGRCNREGRRPAEESPVVYFRSEDPVPPLQKIAVQAAREALKTGGTPAEPETMRRYFTALRSQIGENMDKVSVMKTAREQLLPFETIAGAFHLIDRETCTVYIPLDAGAELCSQLAGGKACREDYRRAGQYGVSVYRTHFQALWNGGDLRLLSEDSAILENPELYSPEMGLSTKADAGRAEFI